MAEIELQVRRDSDVPIFAQLKHQIRLAIASGALEPQAKLPTVRALAAMLDININTAQRAYRELEREGYLTRRQGVGTFTRPEAAPQVPGRGGLEAVLNELKALGYSDSQIIELAVRILGELS